MGDGLFPSRPLRSDDAAGRLLAALDVPDRPGPCRCVVPCWCHGGNGRRPEERGYRAAMEGYPEVCPGEDVCKECPARPCPCITSIDEATFPLTLAEWGEALSAFDPKGCGDPPPPDGPTAVATRKAKASVMKARARAGRALHHPDDLRPTSDETECLAIEALTGKRQGEVRATYHDDEDDPGQDMDLGLDLGRTGMGWTNRNRPAPDDKVGWRSWQLDLAVDRAMKAGGGGGVRERAPGPPPEPPREEERRYVVRVRRPEQVGLLIVEARRRGFLLGGAGVALAFVGAPLESRRLASLIDALHVAALVEEA